MALTHPLLGLAVLLIGLAALALGLLRGLPRPGDGAPIAGASRLRGLPRFRTLARGQARLLALQLAGLAITTTGIAWLLALPVRTDPSSEQRSNRDIVLCLDVSGSMAPVDRQVIDAYLDLAGNLKGERIGFVVFDASAVTLFPLTDDAAFITDQLGQARELLDGSIVPGTQIGSGTSLIGDGLASCVNRFDVPEQDRSRTVVLATDNQVAGQPLFTLDQAIAKASERGVLVAGIVPSDNTPSVTAELTEAIRQTGGDVLLLSPDMAVSTIEDRVLSQERKALEGVALPGATPFVWPGALAMMLGASGWGAAWAVGRRAGGWR